MAKRTYMLALAVALVAAVPQLGVASPDDTNATSVSIKVSQTACDIPLKNCSTRVDSPNTIVD